MHKEMSIKPISIELKAHSMRWTPVSDTAKVTENLRVGKSQALSKTYYSSTDNSNKMASNDILFY